MYRTPSRTTSRRNSCSSKYRLAPRPSQRKQDAARKPAGVGGGDGAGKHLVRDRLVPSELELAHDELSLLGGRAGRPRPEPRAARPAGPRGSSAAGCVGPEQDCRCSQGTDGAAAGEVKCHAPGGGSYAHRGTESRLTACRKPGSLTTLRRSVNVSWAAGPRAAGQSPRSTACSVTVFPAPLPSCPAVRLTTCADFFLRLLFVYLGLWRPGQRRDPQLLSSPTIPDPWTRHCPPTCRPARSFRCSSTT